MINEYICKADGDCQMNGTHCDAGGMCVCKPDYISDGDVCVKEGEKRSNSSNTVYTLDILL